MTGFPPCAFRPPPRRRHAQMTRVRARSGKFHPASDVAASPRRPICADSHLHMPCRNSAHSSGASGGCGTNPRQEARQASLPIPSPGPKYPIRTTARHLTSRELSAAPSQDPASASSALSHCTCPHPPDKQTARRQPQPELVLFASYAAYYTSCGMNKSATSIVNIRQRQVAGKRSPQSWEAHGSVNTLTSSIRRRSRRSRTRARSTSRRYAPSAR